MNGINSRLDTIQEKGSKFEITKRDNQSEAQRDKRDREKSKSIRKLWYNVQSPTLCLSGLSERVEREEGKEKQFEEIMAKMYPNLLKSLYSPSSNLTETQTDKTCQGTSHSNLWKAVIKKNFESSQREKAHYVYRSAMIRLTSDFL